MKKSRKVQRDKRSINDNDDDDDDDCHSSSSHDVESHRSGHGEDMAKDDAVKDQSGGHLGESNNNRSSSLSVSSKEGEAHSSDSQNDGKGRRTTDETNSDGEDRPKKRRKIHKLSLKKTEDFNAKLKKRGVVYIARVPPKMTPTKLKTLLSDFGCPITRLYLTPEDAAARKRRRKLSATNNAPKRYTEGWIEFASKKVAKHVASSLNNTAITNYKRSPHYGDLWNLKYLRKFQWSHLTEKVAYERRVREQKLRLETMQARKETAQYKQMVETGKKLDKIQERKQRQAEKLGVPLEELDGVPEKRRGGVHKRKRSNGQKTSSVNGNDDRDSAAKKAVLGALL